MAERADGEPAEKRRKLSNLELIKAEQERRKDDERRRLAQARSARKDHWLHRGIVVKCVHKELAGGKYYKQKGTVEEVVDVYGAKVRLLDAPTVLRLDQEFLETVIPKVRRSVARDGAGWAGAAPLPGGAAGQIGGDVLVVNGPYAGLPARLEALDVDRFCATVKLLEVGRAGGGRTASPLLIHTGVRH